MMKSFSLFLLSFSLNGFASTTTILMLGDSLTEGYQLTREEAFPALVEKKLTAKKFDVKVINGGSSGATTASGLKRLDWYLKAKPDMMVLALGANDGLRGLKLTETEKNLSAVIEKAQGRGIKVILAGMKMPTNYGEPYRQDFENLFPKLAKKYKTALIPFLLESVAAVPSLNLPDGIHPNGKGHEKLAETVAKSVESEL
jgi:acyl-CoA thioesterase I